MKYLVEPQKLGDVGAVLLAQLAGYRAMTEPPKEHLAHAPVHPLPSPTKMSNRTKRRMKLIAAEKRSKRRAQKAARRRSRGK